MKLSIVPAPKRVEVFEGTASVHAKIHARIDSAMEGEAYRLRVGENGIELIGGSDAALSRARATLDQIGLRYGDALPCLEIEDAPAYGYRGFLIDCVRHFFSIEELKKMIHMAAMFKLNRFHWMFSNDQGWRIESRRYPKLQEIGAWRDGDHAGNYSSDAREGGYYTQAQVRELVDYAADLGIEIVPELDLPGHVIAILAAYPELSCTGAPVRVATTAGIFQDILCAGREEVFEFVENLIDELCGLFPGKYFHIGGDEAPKARWKTCPRCQRRMREEGLTTPQELQGWFMNRVAAHLKPRGKVAVAWNESTYGDNLDPNILVQLWITDREGHLANHTARGGRVLVSPVANCYCDYPYASASMKTVHSIDLAPDGLDASKVAGSECLIWTEYVRDGERLEELTWPRFAAAAEAMWCGKDRPDYEDFARRMEAIFPIFAAHGVKATPPEGWNPMGEEAEAQMKAFRANELPRVAEASRKNAGDV